MSSWQSQQKNAAIMLADRWPCKVRALRVCETVLQSTDVIEKVALSPQLFKTLSVVPAGTWTCDLSPSRPALSQLQGELTRRRCSGQAVK